MKSPELVALAKRLHWQKPKGGPHVIAGDFGGACGSKLHERERTPFCCVVSLVNASMLSRHLQDRGLAARALPNYSGDIAAPIRGAIRKLECKRRARAFSTLYALMGESYALVIRDDHTEPLVVLRLDDFADLAK
jgi:hypothetical protein